MADEYIKKIDALNASKIRYIECLYEDEAGYLEAEADDIQVVFKRDIEAIPAADVRTVVLCKNCIYREVDEYGVHFCTGAMADAPTADDWYCAFGKPRHETAIS